MGEEKDTDYEEYVDTLGEPDEEDKEWLKKNIKSDDEDED